MADNFEIDQLKNIEHQDRFSKYNDSRWQSLPDNNNGIYGPSSGLKFNTLSTQAKDATIIWANAYLQINFTASSGGTAWGAPSGTTTTSMLGANTPPLFFKQSALDLISGISITNSDGAGSILQEDNIQFINHYRNLILKDDDWQKTTGAQLGLSKDTNYTNQSSQYALGAFTPTAACRLDGSSVFYNAGCQERCKLFWNMCNITEDSVAMSVPQVAGSPGYTTNLYYGTVILPLRYLHDSFNRLSFPLPSSAFNIVFRTDYTTVNPLSASNHTLIQVLAAGGTNIPAVPKIVGSTLYYQNIQMNAEDQEYVDKLTAVGSVITTHFLQTDTTIYNTLLPTSNQRIQLSPSVRLPQRVWVLCYPTTSDAVRFAPTLAAGAPFSQAMSLMVPSAKVGTTNIIINGVKYFDNDYVSSADYWNYLREQMPTYGTTDSDGSLINYKDFSTLYNIMVYDVSRKKNRKDINTPVSLEWICSAPVGSPQAVFMVERLVEMRIQFLSGKIHVDVV